MLCVCLSTEEKKKIVKNCFLFGSLVLLGPYYKVLINSLLVLLFAFLVGFPRKCGTIQ